MAGKTAVVTRATSGHGRGPHGGCTLAPAMAETAAVGEPSRTVNISSSGHRGGHIDIDDPPGVEPEQARVIETGSEVGSAARALP